MHRLNKTQLVGLKYVRDFETKIPREEIGDIEQYLLAVARKLVRPCPRPLVLVCVTVGSMMCVCVRLGSSPVPAAPCGVLFPEVCVSICAPRLLFLLVTH